MNGDATTVTAAKSSGVEPYASAARVRSQVNAAAASPTKLTTFETQAAIKPPTKAAYSATQHPTLEYGPVQPRPNSRATETNTTCWSFGVTLSAPMEYDDV